MIIKSFICGFFSNCAIFKISNFYRLASNSLNVSIHPTSSLYGGKCRWIIFHEMILSNKELINICSEIKIEWLSVLAPTCLNFNKFN
mmetsp:Transcript_19012/g.46692  ORF Transcript_19012/g.46692 Transcript_19012/m.46692 type:complete len:87 (+) Transcript_19012:2167-2427(+)